MSRWNRVSPVFLIGLVVLIGAAMLRAAAPIANAGPDQTEVVIGSTVNLDGTASSDPDGDPLTYTWKLLARPAGSAAALSSTSSPTPTFVADRNGTYQVQLTIKAGGESATDTVTITTHNDPPTANAGADLGARIGKRFKIVGTASSDPNGDKLTYAWTLLSQPEASVATIQNANKVSATLTLDRPGTYEAQLQVTDPFGLSDTDTVQITHVNSAPISNGGPDQNVAIGTTVALDASASSDVDEDALTYTWTLQRPKGSGAALIGASTMTPTFVPDIAGTYTATVVANDGAASGKGDKVVVTTSGVNAQPVAHAGRDQHITLGQTVYLDGSQSSDANGDRLTYTWTLAKIAKGSVAVLSSTSAVRPSFVADRPGTYVASLVVTDPALRASVPDSVIITTLNAAPVADAGVDQVATVGAPVQLRGDGSTDLDGQELAFGWALLQAPAGSAAALSDATAVNPTLTPDVAGTYQLQLIVNDGVINSAADTVLITTGNARPRANAGADDTVSVGAVVTLDGTASSDPNGDALTYQWTLVARPAGSAAGVGSPTTAISTFTADVAGTYVAQLRVSDGALTSALDTVVISTAGSLPVSDAGPDQSVAVGDVVTLTSAGSSDADGSPLTRRWSFVSRPDGSAASLSSQTAASPTFTADVDGIYVVQLIVNDGTANGAPDTVTIDTGGAPPPNQDPVADAGPDQVDVPVGTLVTLDGSGSDDPDAGDTITFAWAFTARPAGSGATLSGAATVSPTFTPDLAGLYTVQLTVTDSHGATDVDTVDVTAIPPPPVLTISPASLGMLTSSTATLTVTLPSAAPAGGVAVTLSSDQPSRASVPANVTVAQGATSAQVTVTAGTEAGAAVITATAAGYGSDTTNVTVSNRTMTLTLDSNLVGVGRTVNGTITLANPAPSGGVSIALASSNTGLATVSPASVSIAEGETSGSFSVSGVSPGSPTITGTAPGFTNGTRVVTVTNAVVNLPPAQTIAPSQTSEIALSLSSPAPAGGVTVALSSSDTNIATVSPANVFIAEGLMVPAANPQITGIGVGNAVITGTAPGYAPDQTDVTVTLILSFTPTTLSVVETTSKNITLNTSAPAPAGGLVVNLSIADTTKATVPATATVPAGATSVQVPVSGVAVGSTTLTASGTGITSANATINVTAAPPINVGDLLIGKDMIGGVSGSLGAAAPAGNLTVTITSADTSRVLLSNASGGAGSESITVTVSAGTFGIPTFYVHSLVDSGTTTITVTAPGYKSDTSTITHYPSGFVTFNGNFTTTTFSTNTNVPVYFVVLAPTTLTYYTWGYSPRPGVTINVPVTSSDTAVGTIVTSPITFTNATGATVNAQFDPLAAGTTTISIGTPAGFSTPSEAFRRQITATVTAPNVYFNTGATTIGAKDLQTYVDVYLDAAPPAGSPVDVTIASADGAIATLGKVADTDAGTSVTFTGVTGTSVGRVYINSRSVNTVTLTASATGYNSDTVDVNVYPSGFVTFTGSFTTTTFSPNTAVGVYAVVLSPATLAYYTWGYNLRPGITVNVPVTSSDTTVGTITTSPVVFSHATGAQVNTQFDPVNAGTSTIAIGVPAGFSTPSEAFRRQITATVTAPNIYFGSGATTLGAKNLQTYVDVYLDAAPPAGSPVDVTVTSADGTRVTLGTTSAVDAGGSVTFSGVTTTYAGRVYVNGRTEGDVTLTASGTGYNSDTVTVNVYPSGFVFLSGSFATTTFSANTNVGVYAVVLSPTTLAYYTWGYTLRPGISVDVAVASSNTSVGAITTSPVTFTNATGAVVYTQFDPLSTGTTDLTVGVPAGFSTPSEAFRRTITATVTAPNVQFSSSSYIVGKDLQGVVDVYLEAAPPSPVTVTVTSSGTTVATITTDPLVAGGASVTFNNVSTTYVGRIYLQGRSLSTTTLNASAAGYDTGVANVTVYPSAFLLLGGNFTTSAGAANTTVYVYPALLDPTTLNYYTWGQPIRGGLSNIQVPVTSDNTAVGTITTSPVVFNAGDLNLATQFDPVGAGTAVISVGVPAGFSTPSNYGTATATVNP